MILDVFLKHIVKAMLCNHYENLNLIRLKILNFSELLVSSFGCRGSGLISDHNTSQDII